MLFYVLIRYRINFDMANSIKDKCIMAKNLQQVTKPTTKPVVKGQTIPSQSKVKTLHFFSLTPAGKMLRAYFIAFITVQTGKLEAGKNFKLWPSANIRGHLDTKKVIRKDGMYSLSAAGYNYFTDPEQLADKDMVSKFTDSIKTGKAPSFYKHEMMASK